MSFSNKAQKSRVLIVDDDMEVLQFLDDLLSSHFDVVAVNSAELGYEYACDQPFDVVLTDYRMSVINGLQLAKKISNLNPCVPIIIMTGFANHDLTLDAIRARIFDFIDKPFEDHSIIDTIERAVVSSNIEKNRQDMLKASYEQEVRLKLAHEHNMELQVALAELDQRKGQLINSERLASLGVLAAGIAHELNNPLAIIIGMTHLLKKYHNGHEDTLTKCSKIIDSGRRMQKIIDQMRNHGRRDNIDDWSKVSLKECVDDAFVLLREKIIDASVNLEFDVQEDLPKFIGHEIKIHSVLQNLIKNSIDAFEDNGIVGAEIKVSGEVLGDTILLTYTDNAGGIPKYLLDQVFDPFFTTKDTSRGTGLGLYIVEKIMREHGGKIDISVEEDMGTKFSLTFPLNKKTERQSHLPKPYLDLSGRPRLLIVEHERYLVDYLSEIFRKDWDITAHNDLRDGMLDVSQNAYDLIICDMQFPQFSGIDLLIRTREVSQETVFLLTTGRSKKDPDVMVAYEYGVNDIITKPLGDPAKFMDKINSYFRIKKNAS